jgi:hypothetical protein
MSFSCLSRLATLALLPLLSFAAIAQQAQQAGPADPRASVPVPVYVSAFKTYQPAADAPATPDRAWRAANEAAANNDPHAGHMPMPAAALQGDGPKAANAPAPVPAAADAPTQADPHAGHGGHHH